MNIGDKVIPVDIAGTSSLDPNKEYIVVDINEYGNIGLKDPAAGCLLEHYYKPRRLKLAPKAPKVEVGQVWLNKDTKNKYMVCYVGHGYVLCSLTDGWFWSWPQKTTEEVFTADYAVPNDFELVARSIADMPNK